MNQENYILVSQMKISGDEYGGLQSNTEVFAAMECDILDCDSISNKFQ